MTSEALRGLVPFSETGPIVVRDGVLAKALLDSLVCPKSKEPLIYFPRGEADRDEAEGFLLSPGSRLRYRVVSGFPDMLPEEAEELSEAQVTTLVARARELGLSVPA